MDWRICECQHLPPTFEIKARRSEGKEMAENRQKMSRTGGERERREAWLLWKVRLSKDSWILLLLDLI